MKKNFSNAFSLMEMMVVLLIVAIIAAATAPMLTKKMSRNTGTGDSPWVFTGDGRSIAFNLNDADDGYVIIGAPKYNSKGVGPNNPRLVLAGGTSIAYADKNGNYTGTFSLGNSEIKIGSGDVGENSVFVGTNVSASGMGNVTAIGSTIAANNNAVIIGTRMAAGANAVVIGSNDSANQITSGSKSVAVGYKARAAEEAVAIGSNATAKVKNSIAIGSGAEADEINQIVLGTAADTVYIKGNLVVDGNVALAVAEQQNGGRGRGNNGKFILMKESSNEGKYDIIQFGHAHGQNGNMVSTRGQEADNHNSARIGGIEFSVLSSDRRLKNVGDKYVAGLDELNKLDFYHYTFKKDEAKTPMVGVMAQDLQKVFPDAVVKGDDGFLRIRMDDMFYASLNAIKELDSKVREIVKNITDVSARIDAQQKTIEEQQMVIKNLQAQNDEFEKRLTKLEGNKCKCNK